MSDVISQWDKAAKLYAQSQERSEFVDSNKEVVFNRFTVSDMKDNHVLDLGCGYGIFTKYFHDIAADVIGVDGSAEMIKIAKDYYPDCSFSIIDITKALPFESESFDLIFCNQVLMDIEDVEPLFKEINRILKHNGILYFSIVHPGFYDCHWIKDENGYRYAKVIQAYIKHYQLKNEFWGETTHFHRPLSYYLNLAADSGFTLRHIEEPISYDGINKNSDLPLFLFAEYIKEKNLYQNK